MDAVKRIFSELSCIVTLCLIGLSLVLLSGKTSLADEGVAGTIVADTGDIGIVVERARIEEGDRIYKCKYCGKFIDVGIMRKDAEHIIKERLQEVLAEHGIGFRSGRSERPYIEVLIYRFRERQGGNFAVEEPAGVGFHMHLMEGNGLKNLFIFDKDQRPLSTDPLGIERFVQRGGKWVTVEELAGEGIKEGIDHFTKSLP